MVYANLHVLANINYFLSFYTAVIRVGVKCPFFQHIHIVMHIFFILQNRYSKPIKQLAIPQPMVIGNPLFF